MFTLRVALEVNMAVGQNHGFATIRPGALPALIITPANAVVASLLKIPV
jgi:hypothetical protein